MGAGDNDPPFRAVTGRLLGGWYMLEVKATLPRVRLVAGLTCSGRTQSDRLVELRFPVYSGRLCKRLVQIGLAGKLELCLPCGSGEVDLQHFRVARVSQKFARSRLVTKLRALHPRYKSGWAQHRNPGRDVLAGPVSLGALWSDYCELFDETPAVVPYPGWVQAFDRLVESDRALQQAKGKQFAVQPLISVVVPVYNPHPAWLKQAIESVLAQTYGHWQLCIADDASTDPAIRPMLEGYALSDSRIQVFFRKENGHISAASNSALTLARGEWVALLDHDDLLAEHALFWVVDAINRDPDCQLIYSDEDKVDELGLRSEPYFKSDWNPEMFLSQNMFSHLGVYKAELVARVGGFRKGLEGSQDYDLALRCIEHITAKQVHHVPRILYHWRMHGDSTAHTNDAKPYAVRAGERALGDHLVRTHVRATAEAFGVGYRVRYALPANPPVVTIIIPSRNGGNLLQKCVGSVLAKTTYPAFELLIIDNGSDDPATLQLLHDWSRLSNVRVVRDARPFNYSALNNAAVRLAGGEVIALVNDDIEVISPDWLSEMVSHALRPAVGAVGARLLYADGSVQHAGIVLGINGATGHGHRFLPGASFGYCGRASLIQSYSAVTGACLVVRKALYEALGGLNETDLQVACNDVDFCLRLREAGYRNVWTPYAELYHRESSTRGYDDTPEKLARSAREIAYMQKRWGMLLQNDPAYNPNLTLDAEDFGLAWPPRVAPLAPLDEAPNAR